MRTQTKRLFTVVTFMALSVAATRADSYNVNLTGSGNYNFLGNELNNSAGNYISNVLQNLAPGSLVLKFNPASQSFYTAQQSDTLNPGEGVAVSSALPRTITITGSAAVAQPPLTLSPGQFMLVSRRAGGLGPSTYDDLVGSPPVEGSTLLLWSVAIQDFVAYSYHDNQWNGPAGPSTAPQVAAGYSAFVVLQPALSVSNAPGGQIIITWSAPKTWTLEGADNMAGPWTTLTNATSPYTIPTPTQSQKFYRLHGGLGPPSSIQIQ